MDVPSIDVGNLFLLGVVSASIHWLLARSAIFEFFWGRTRGFLEKLLTCAACSGFWIGIGLGLGGVRPVQDVAWWAQIAGAGFMGIWLTPVFEGVLMWGLQRSRIVPVLELESPSIPFPEPTGFQSAPLPPPPVPHPAGQAPSSSHPGAPERPQE